jgi:hypothetical protein
MVERLLRRGIPVVPAAEPLAPERRNKLDKMAKPHLFFFFPLLPHPCAHAIQLASIVSEWFRSPEHGAQDEAAFVEFLKFKAKR